MNFRKVFEAVAEPLREYYRAAGAVCVVSPTLFGILSEAIGVTALHCACVARNGRALLLAGESGSGKSTLSLVLALSGFGFLSDDWTYFSRRDGRLLAWGLTLTLKLLPDAVRHFPDLLSRVPVISSNGELAYEVDPVPTFGVEWSACAEPSWIVFLERQEGAGLSLTEMSPVDAAARFEEHLEALPAPAAEGRDFLLKTITNLVQRPCWLLRYDQAPRAIAQVLTQLLAGDGLTGGAQHASQH